MNKNEELLIKRAQRGVLQAFEALVKKYDDKVMRITYNMVNNVEDARDIYQEVFLKVYRSIDKFRFQSEFYSWLFRIVVNTCLSFRSKRAKHRHDSLGDYVDSNDKYWEAVNKETVRDPEDQLLNLELSEQIQHSINQLSPKQRTVFVLKHYQGYKLNEIAEIMECSEGTVKNYHFRAIQKLKNLLRVYQQS